MKIEKFEEKIDLPEGVQSKIEKGVITLSKDKDVTSRILRDKKVLIECKEGAIILSFTKGTKQQKMIAGTFRAHIKNMIKGVTEGHVYKLKVCSGHFPMNVTVSKDKVIVNNFLGEKIPRELKLKEDVSVKLDGDIITVEGTNKELTAQTAASIEKLTTVRGKDLRIYQDGIYITNKDGRDI
jgi:large subunit ribosomal protein L6